MWIADVVRIADEKLQRMAQRLRDYRGDDLKRVQQDWSSIVVYQQAEIECLMRNLRAVCASPTVAHTFDPKIDWPAGTTELETLPPPKFTHATEFDAFVARTRNRLDDPRDQPGFDEEAETLRSKLFGPRKKEQI